MLSFTLNGVWREDSENKKHWGFIAEDENVFVSVLSFLFLSEHTHTHSSFSLTGITNINFPMSSTTGNTPTHLSNMSCTLNATKTTQWTKITGHTDTHTHTHTHTGYRECLELGADRWRAFKEKNCVCVCVCLCVCERERKRPCTTVIVYLCISWQKLECATFYFTLIYLI